MEQNNSNELQHWGIKGMKWGVRRYQNKDGSLTPAGRKRSAKLKEEYTNLTGKRLVKKSTNSKSQQSDRPKTAREMTDEELRTKTNRMNLENNYDTALNRMRELHPQQVSAGKKFVDKVVKDVFVPAATEAGKNAVRKYLDDVLEKSMKRN